ncbi:MAG: hypothetical protein AAF389_21060 [Gemmatimonadota bacterium]
MPDNSVRVLRVLGAGVCISVLIPPVVFLAVGLGSGMGAEAWGALVDQYRTDRLNLGVLGAVGVIPFLALVVLLALHRRFADPAPGRSMAVAGGVVIAALLVWAHATYWPSFLPDQVAPSWPHGIEFVVVPLFFAPVGAVVGMIAGYLLHRSTNLS